ncbi:MAG: hypothetical protein KTR31_32760 [Myxococcales bacterium]|nr:hypothetical protein [Myxococcales bacterium]
MDKRRLIDAHRVALQTALSSLRIGQDAARAGTRVDGTHRPASRGERAAVTSEGYLAQGLNQRIADLEGHLRVLAEVTPTLRKTVANGALVSIEDEQGRRQTLFVVPGGDGTVHDGVALVSSTSPWIRPFLGQGAGEVADVVVGGNRVEIELLEVS